MYQGEEASSPWLEDIGTPMEQCPSIYGFFLSFVIQGRLKIPATLRRNPNSQSDRLGLQERAYHRVRFIFRGVCTQKEQVCAC